MGVTEWTALFIIITFMLYLSIGWMARVRETKGFYVAGQGVPAIANGAATAADWMSAASFISMAGLISFHGFDGARYLLGWTGGYVLLALLLAPYLRKFGKYTVPEFVGDRYYSTTARVVAVICAIFISVTYVAGQMRGVGIVFSRFLDVDIFWGVIIGMGIVAFFAVLGGMKGITWTQVAQYCILICAFLIPAIMLSAKLTGNPIPQVALASSDIMEKLELVQKDLGFKQYSKAFEHKSKIDLLFITLSLMVGTAGLPHVIVRFYTVPNVRAARFSAGWALLFIAILYTTAPALAVFARYNIIETLNEQPHEEIQKIEWVQKWGTSGLLKFVDKNNDGDIQYRPGNAFLKMEGSKKLDFSKPDMSNENEVYLDKDTVVLLTPEISKLPPWVIALVAAGGLAAALSTAAGLLLVISSSIAHDIYYRIINPEASEKKRVFVGRVMVVVAVVLSGHFGYNPPAFVGEVVAFAFGFAAASFFPVIILGIFDKRTNREGAISGMIAGLGFTFFYIVAIKYFAMKPWWGISAEGIGTVGMMLNFAVTLTVSHLTKPPPEEVQRMVEELRKPDHPGPALILDEESVD